MLARCIAGVEIVCLLFIVGGVAFPSLKKDDTGAYKLKFAQTALLFGMIGNTFAAFKGSENKKLMTKEGLKDRIGGVGNQFALTEVLGFFISLPVMFYIEGANFGKFVDMVKGDATLDGSVDIEDLLFVLSGWGLSGSHDADLDESDQVDIGDLLLVLSDWGASPW